jgi:hypothetical protein
VVGGWRSPPTASNSTTFPRGIHLYGAETHCVCVCVVACMGRHRTTKNMFPPPLLYLFCRPGDDAFALCFVLPACTNIYIYIYICAPAPWRLHHRTGKAHTLAIISSFSCCFLFALSTRVERTRTHFWVFCSAEPRGEPFLPLPQNARAHMCFGRTIYNCE